MFGYVANLRTTVVPMPGFVNRILRQMHTVRQAYDQFQSFVDGFPDYQHAKTCQIHLTWKSMNTAAAVLNFGKCRHLIVRYLNQIWWEDTTIGYVEMITWPKVEVKRKSGTVVCRSRGLIDYNKFWTKFGAELKHHTTDTTIGWACKM